MDAGTLMAVAKLAAFGLIVRAWLVSRRVAEDARAERAAREAAERDAATRAAAAAEPAPMRDAA